MDADPLLFVYGTLMRGFPLHALLAGRADSVGDGEVGVRLAGGRQVTAYIYWYVGPLRRAVPIPGGDYRAHAPARSIYHR